MIISLSGLTKSTYVESQHIKCNFPQKKAFFLIKKAITYKSLQVVIFHVASVNSGVNFSQEPAKKQKSSEVQY